LLTEAEVAEYLGVHPETVARERRRGRLPWRRIGGQIRFTQEDADAYRRRAEGAALPNWPPIPVLGIDELRALPPATSDESLNASGVYFLWLGEALVYIGQSTAVGDRVQRHADNCRWSKDPTKSGRVLGRVIDFDAATWMPVEWPFHLCVEAVYIKAHRPRENRRVSACF
jgi:excisionase family DNA binding protein